MSLHQCPFRGCTVMLPDSQYHCDKHAEISARNRKIGSDRVSDRRREQSKRNDRSFVLYWAEREAREPRPARLSGRLLNWYAADLMDGKGRGVS